MAMRHRTAIVAAITLMISLLMVPGAQARRQPVPRMYMFGLAASFTDTIVHITPIQAVDSAWVETKNGFLLEREAYSAQLRDFLAHEQQMQHRTCIVFYNTKRDKLEKKMQKMLKLYTKPKDGQRHFDLRRLEDGDFSFKAVSAEIEEETEGETGGEVSPKAKKKQKQQAKRKRDKGPRRLGAERRGQDN